jgi:nucleoside-diphosphate-sugar epimerase
MKRVLVTGANGFIGRALCARLAAAGMEVAGAVRKDHSSEVRDFGARPVVIGDLGSQTDWMVALTGMDCVVHLAARVHVMHEVQSDPLAAFREVNTFGAARLATQAVAAGVRRLVYVSTIKVSGEYTRDKKFSEQDQPQPSDPYAISKWEAEQALHKLAVQTGLEIVVVRPPLVYGPGVKGNFYSLLRLVDLGLPLPLGRCRNQRSLVGLTNLVDLLAQCVAHPAATGQIFLAADSEDLSTPELLRRVALAFGKRESLLPVPTGLLQFAARLVGRAGIYERLCGSLQVDAGNTQRVLGWVPPRTVNDELMRTVQWYLSKKNTK